MVISAASVSITTNLPVFDETTETSLTIESSTDTDEDIDKIFETYENKYINNQKWDEEKILPSDNNPLLISSRKPEEVQLDVETTTVFDDIVKSVQTIVEDFNETTAKQNETMRDDRTIVVVVTTNIYLDENDAAKNKQMHNELSFGNSEFLVSQQKQVPRHKSMEMHNQITNEFFNSNDISTENVLPNVTNGRSISYGKTQENMHTDSMVENNVPISSKATMDNFQEQQQNLNLHQLEPLAKILDSEVREEFTKDIPSNQHVPLNVERSEDRLEYVPLKDISEYVIEEIQSEPVPDDSLVKKVQENQNCSNKYQDFGGNSTHSETRENTNKMITHENPNNITKVSNIIIDPENVIPPNCKIAIGSFEFGKFDCFNNTESKGKYNYYYYIITSIPLALT